MDIDDGDTVSDEHVGNVAEAGTSGIFSSSRPGSDERTADRPAPSNATSNEGNEPNAGPSVQIPSGASQDDRNADTFSAFYVGINRWPNEEEDNFSDISNDALDMALEEDSAAEENHNFDGEEDHLRERDIEDPGPDAVQFDTNLPAEHSYLGNNMNRVSGVEYLETNRVHRIMLFLHHHIVYPGEVIPFMIPGFIIEDDIDSSNGLLFGLAFPNVRCVKTLAMYGVTCQIYEKGDGERGQTMIKARALQRFVTMSDTRREHLEYITSTPHVKTQGNVKVLPEIYLPEILSTVNLGSMNRFRDIPQLECLIKDFQATTTVWPKYIYNQYNIKMLVEKVIKSLEAHKVESMPHDPVRLSFWLSRNAHFSDEQLKSIFTTDSVNLRMKIISDSFNDAGIFICRFCRNQIAACRDLFAMSKHGVQSQYCNSAGFIHETNTVYKVFSNAVTFSGEPSSEFSWFPGYEWTIIVCKICSRHIGWQFRASVRNLTPALFYGITGASVRIDKGEKRRALRDHLLLNNLIQLVDLQ